MFRAILLLFLLIATSAAGAAVQPGLKNCLLPSCIPGYDANGKLVPQPFSGGGTVGPAGPAGPTGATGPVGPAGPQGPAGVNGGPFTVKTYTAGTVLAPGTWYMVPGTANTAIPLPPAGTAPWTNPAQFCITNIGTGQVTFSAAAGIVNGPVFLSQGQTYCFGITDSTPPGWLGDGGN